MYLSAAAAISMAAWSPYFLEWPILMTAGFGQPVWMVGWVYALLTLARVIGAEIVTRLSPSRDARPARASVSVAGAAVLLFAAGAAGGGPIITFALLFLMNVCTGAIQPLTMSWFNEHIDSSRRATLISFNSMLQTLGGSIGLLASGYVVDRAGIPIAWQLAGVIALGAIPLYLALRPRSPLEVAGAQAVK
jgi:MFS family permease